MPLGRLCAADHADFDPQSRPGKNIWPAFEGESSSQRRTSIPAQQGFPLQHGSPPAAVCMPHRPVLLDSGVPPASSMMRSRPSAFSPHTGSAEAIRTEIARLLHQRSGSKDGDDDDRSGRYQSPAHSSCARTPKGPLACCTFPC